MVLINSGVSDDYLFMGDFIDYYIMFIFLVSDCW